ncbi:MAG: succinate dehydrogenase [Gammaproteobacteria bacterium]|nr:succinate dehydrogenase [Gammaproteobacteria bacterium]
MSPHIEARLWLAQRASAMVLAVAVIVHLATIIYAVRGGLSAAEIAARLSGDVAWLAFYLVFVLAVAVHAPLGLRTVLGELTPLAPRTVDALAALFAVLLATTGAVAAAALFTLEV